MTQGIQPVDGVKRGDRIPSELGRFARDVHFQEDGDNLGTLSGVAIDFLRQREAVDALDHCEKGDGFADFVGLEMADEMPSGGTRTEWDFGPRLLDPVFAEKVEPESDGFRDGVGGMVFGHGQEGHVFRAAAAAEGRTGDAFLQGGQIFSESGHGPEARGLSAKRPTAERGGRQPEPCAPAPGQIFGLWEA